MKARYRYNEKTRLRRNQIIGIHGNANTGNVNLAIRCVLFRKQRPDLRTDMKESKLIIVSQLASSIRKKKRSEDRSETRHQRVRTHCKKRL
jgi:hypothetical protein